MNRYRIITEKAEGDALGRYRHTLIDTTDNGVEHVALTDDEIVPGWLIREQNMRGRIQA